MLDILKKLAELPGVSGNALFLSDAGAAQCRPYTKDITSDKKGNAVIYKEGAEDPGRRIAFWAHLDESGFIVTGFDDSGLLKFSAVGNIDPRTVNGKRVKIGPRQIPGVISTKAIHLQDAKERKTVPDMSKLYIDIGAKTAADAMTAVDYGDCAVFESEFSQFGDNLVCCKALGNRAGCAVLLKLIKSALPFSAYFVFDTLSSLVPSAADTLLSRVRPDTVILLEPAPASDYPPAERKSCAALRKGAVITAADEGIVYDTKLFSCAVQAARKNNIPFQIANAVKKSPSACEIQGAAGGARVLNLGIPCRYDNTPSGVIALSDLDALYALCSAVLNTAGQM